MVLIAKLSLCISFVLMAICIQLVARTWSPDRLLFVHLGRPLNDLDRARVRRLTRANWLVCLVGVAGSLLVRDQTTFLLLATLLPLVPVAWLLAEVVGLLRSLPTSRVPGRYLVPLSEQPSLTSYISAPLQVANVALLLVTTTLFIGLWTRLPDLVPMHWNFAGKVDRHGDPAEFLLFAVWMLLDLGLAWFVAWMVSKERWALPTEHAERYVGLQRQRRAMLVRLVEWMILGLNGSIAVMWLSMAAGSLPGNGWLRSWGMGASLGLMLVATVVPLAVFIRPLVQLQDRLRALAGSDVLGTRGDGWRWAGMVYYAPDDPTLVVPKRVGIGSTLNFGRPAAWLIIGAITVLPLALTGLVILLS